MFGVLTAAPGSLTPEEYERYKACYCGLCRSLKERFGNISRLTLNYDMTFLILLLNSLYEPEETKGNDNCIAHPFKEREWFRSEISDYAADMNIALSYLKCLDNWKDDGSVLALTESSYLKKAYEKIKTDYPTQCAAMEKSISELGKLEDTGNEDADAAAATFGHLMGTVFIYKDDRWSKTLYNFGNALGKYIYLLDAMLDLDMDTVKNHYNPFRRYYGLTDNRKLFSTILKMFLSDAVLEFDRLPLVQDASILKNILCVGLWSKFEEKYGSV